jgi:hypothetical protein
MCWLHFGKRKRGRRQKVRGRRRQKFREPRRRPVCSVPKSRRPLSSALFFTRLFGRGEKFGRWRPASKQNALKHVPPLLSVHANMALDCYFWLLHFFASTSAEFTRAGDDDNLDSVVLVFGKRKVCL